MAPSSPTAEFAAALSTQPATMRALAEVCAEATRGLSQPADLGLVFVSPHHAPQCATIAAEIGRRTGVRHLLGTTGETIVGGAREVEGQPAISLWLAHLPGVRLDPLRLEFEQTPEGGSFVGWPESLAGEWAAGATLLLVGEPYTFPVDHLLERLNDDRPGALVVGGMASGGGPGEHHLMLGSQSYDSGAVGVLVSGDIRVRTIVSQGCRPIGQHLVITKAHRNVIQELGGRPPLVHLQEIFPTLSPREQQLVQHGLHVGRVINEYQDHFARGDFLVRNVIGADPSSGAVAIGDFVRPGQTVQFHLRDAQAADEDLRELLAAVGSHSEGRDRGAILFTCNGRGTRLFDAADHDARAVCDQLGPVALAGFFAQGEIGPIGGRNFLHGFTASVALFEPAT